MSENNDPVEIVNRDGMTTPWAVCAVAPNPYWHAGRTIHGAGKHVAEVGPLMTPRVEAAVAHLIAAAPELYAALATFVDEYVQMVNSGDCGNSDPELDDKVIAARSALSRARGEKE